MSAEDLLKIRRIIKTIITLLEKNIQKIENGEEFEIDENQKKLFDFLIGSKDNVLSTITKLTNLLIKVAPLDEDEEVTKVAKLEQEDLEILERYIKKYSEKIDKKN